MNSKIVCSHCHLHLPLHGFQNPKKILAGHLAHCPGKRKSQDVELLNYADTYEQYDFDQDSETDSIIYPIEMSHVDSYNYEEERPLNETYFFYQSTLLNQIENLICTTTIKNSRIIDTSGSKVQGNILDYIDISRFVTSSGLSSSQGTDLLQLLRNISFRHKFNLCIPSNMRTINNSLNSKTNIYTEVKEIIIPYPPDIFNIPDIRLVKGYYLNPLQIIAEILLNLPKESIILKPINQFANEGDRLITSYASANQFRLIYNHVQQTFGLDTYPICLSMNYDSMSLESMGKKSAKPLKISILNINQSNLKLHDNVITVAFGPEFPYTDLEYENLLSRFVHTSSKKKSVLQYMRR